jgi:hypothetical protein
MKFRVAYILIPFSFGFGQATSMTTADESKPSISITIPVRMITARIGSPVRVQATVTNTSGQRLAFPGRGRYSGKPVHRMGAIVRDSHGNDVPKTVYGWSMLGYVIEADPKRRSQGLSEAIRRRPIEDYLDAGDSSTEEFELAREFELTVPGKYTVEVGMAEPKGGRTVLSNKIEIVITP